MFNSNSAFEASRRVLAEMLKNGEIDGDVPRAVTEALRRELVLKDVREKADELRKCETLEEFPEVAELYQVTAVRLNFLADQEPT
jgi:hypothetical protein